MPCLSICRCIWETPKTGTFTNSEDPDEMQHYVKVKKIFRRKNTLSLKIYSPTPLDYVQWTIPNLLVLFGLNLYCPVNNFSVMSGLIFMGLTSTKQGLLCLAQGHNTVTPVRLEPATPWSPVKLSTTEPLGYHPNLLYKTRRKTPFVYKVLTILRPSQGKGFPSQPPAMNFDGSL